jgi:hypothetical protein
MADADAPAEAAAAAPDAAAAAAEGGGGDAAANPAPAAPFVPPSAAELAALAQALQGGDAAAQLASCVKVIEVARDLKEREEQQLRFCDAMVELGAVEALLQLLSGCSPDDERAEASARALSWLTVSSAAAVALLTAGGLALLMRIMRADASGVHIATLPVTAVFKLLMEEIAAARDAFAADAEFNRQVNEILGHKDVHAEAVANICQGLYKYVQQNVAARNALRSAHCLPVLAALLSDDRHEKAWPFICSILTTLQRSLDGGNAEATHAGFSNEGIYAACVAVLSTVTASADPFETLSGSAVHLAAGILRNAFVDASEVLRPLLRQYVLAQPGALASAAHAARVCTDVNKRTALIGLLKRLRDDVVVKAVPGAWLLDAHYAACAVMQLRVTDGDLVRHFVAEWRTETCWHVLANPLPHQSLPSAVSLACLATEDARFVKLLASGTRLQTLCDALVAAAAERCSSEVSEVSEV